MAITVAMRTQVAQLYTALFGRAPESDGLGYWVGQLDAGKSFAQVADAMYATTPARVYYPSFLTNDEIVGRFYTNVLGRTATADDISYWSGKLAAKGATPGGVIGDMIYSVTAYTGTDAAALASQSLFNNKVTVGLYYAVDLGGNDVAKAGLVLQGVTSTASSVDAAKVAAAGVAGQTFALTTGIDNIVGTTGNDTIIGDNSGTAATVTAGDQVAGGAGTDTFKFYTATGVAVTAPALSGIENLFISGNDTSDVDLSAGAFATVNRLIIDNAGATKLYTLGAGDTFALQNTAGATGANVVFSSADASTIVTFDSVGTRGANGAVDLKGTSLATVTLDVANKNYVTLNNTAGATITKTVNVTGAGSLVLDANANTLTGITKVDASANTGGVTFVAPDSKLTFTGGSGNDQVEFAATKLTADDKLVGGAGTDVIKVNDTAIDAAANDVVKGLNASTGFETLALAAGTSTVDFDMIAASGIKNVRDDAAGAQTLNNATNATVVEIAAGVTVGAADLTIANKLGQTTTNIKLDATSAGTASVAQLVLTGVSDIKIESDFAGTGAQATANVLTVKTQADNSVFTVTGDHALDLTLKSAAASVGSTVNAAGLTKTLTVVGTAKADSITGGSGNDSFIGNTDGAAAGADTFTGGAGNDSFKFDALSIDVVNMATITDFAKGDKLVLDLSGGAGAFVKVKVDVSAAATLADAIGLADGTAKNVSWFNFDGNTYVVSAGATTTAITDDTIVKLVGTLDLSASTFVAATDTLTFA